MKEPRKFIGAVFCRYADNYQKDDGLCPENCDQDCSDKEKCPVKKILTGAWRSMGFEDVRLTKEQYLNVCIQSNILHKNIYRILENELKNYPQTLKKSFNLNKSQDNRYGPPKTAEQEAFHIQQDQEIAELEKIIKAINNVSSQLDEKKAEVMRNMWDKKDSLKTLSQDLGYEEKTIRRWEKEIVYLLAMELNYL